MGIQQALLGGTYSDYIVLNNRTIAQFVSSPTTALAGYRLTGTGATQETVSNSYTTFDNWIFAASNSSLYEARATLTAGSFSGGSGAGVWLNLGSAQTWFITQTGFGSNLCTFTIEIRQSATGIILASAGINLNAEVI